MVYHHPDGKTGTHESHYHAQQPVADEGEGSSRACQRDPEENAKDHEAEWNRHGVFGPADKFDKDTPNRVQSPAACRMGRTY